MSARTGPHDTTAALDRSRRYLVPVARVPLPGEPDVVHLSLYEWLPRFGAWATGLALCGYSAAQGALPDGTEVTCTECLKYKPGYEEALDRQAAAAAQSQPDGSCPFCEIVAGRAEAEWILQPDYWPDAVAFVPLKPVVEGHVLIVPKRHVRDFAADPEVFAATARRAAELMRWTPRPMNVITSRGREATQSVFHLHLHLVPRAADDGLALPWYSGRRRTPKES